MKTQERDSWIMFIFLIIAVITFVFIGVFAPQHNPNEGERFEYEGHTYLRFRNGVCHDGNCQCNGGAE